MIAIVGATIGQVGVFDYDIEANINQAIALIRFDEKTDSEFVKSFYLSSLGQKVLDRAKRPVARANINLDEIGSLSIIHPPLSIQQEIATHIRNLRIEAQALKTRAEVTVKEAKLEIENILLK
jgi:type I restriction enzyme S subunit